MTKEKDYLRIAIVGHVDHGKSTLVGRLLNDTGSLPDGKLEMIREVCSRRGVEFEWAFLMDSLQAERDQGVTIDTSQIWFQTDTRNYVIIDAPGHKEFLKNMVTGAAASDAALLIIDAEEGVKEQSLRHGYLLHLLGVRQIAVAVNKMDIVKYSSERFEQIKNEYSTYLSDIGVEATYFVPVSAREGENIVKQSTSMNWWKGPTIIEALENFKIVTRLNDLPLRMPIQDVYRFDKRIFAGRIESGSLHVGDKVLFSPSNKISTIKSIEDWGKHSVQSESVSGQSIGFTLEDQIFAERGELVSHKENPPIESDVFRAKVFWLGERPLNKDARLKIKLNSSEAEVRVQEIEKIIDTSDLSTRPSDKVERNTVAELILQADRILAFDEFHVVPSSGRFVLIDNYQISGGGIISMDGYADQRNLITIRSSNIQRVEHSISIDARSRRNGHQGGVLWFTGLSGAGKSTLAVATERSLFNLGYQVYVLDGDNIRHGLNADLGFSPRDRSENIRRIGEVAALMSLSGLIVITAFISPYRSDRKRARKAIGETFHEIHVKADLSVCEKRDPKGLYAKARRGEIEEFTGISAPYEPPEDPELIIDTDSFGIDESVDSVIQYIKSNFQSNDFT